MEARNMSFEDQWNEAFSGAEISPPEHIWTSIDGALANQAAGKSKKRVIFFQWVAAASVFIAVVSLLTLWNNLDQENSTLADSSESIEQIQPELPQDDLKESQTDQQQVATLEESSNSDLEDKEIEESVNSSNSRPENKVKIQSGEQLITDRSVTNKSQENESSIKNKSQIENDVFDVALLDDDDKKTLEDENTPLLTIVSEENNEDEVVYTQYSEDEFITLTHVDRRELAERSSKPEVNIGHLYGVPILNAGKNTKFNDFELWAGLSFGSGSFDPGTDASDASSLALSAADFPESEDAFASVTSLDQVPFDPQYASGTSLSAGIDLGGRISEKLILSSGLYFSSVNPPSSSNIIVTESESSRSFSLTDNTASNESLENGIQSGALVLSPGTASFNNSLQYISVPFKAGYILVDRKFSLTLNSGFSTNFLIASNLNQSDDSGVQAFGASGANETFRSTYFDLLTSLQFGYNVNNKYSLSLEPNYRYAINNFTKSGSLVSGRPTNLGISIGLKYNF